MKTNMTKSSGLLKSGLAMAMALGLSTASALAGEAATSATAGSNGTAGATASYNGGGPGIARTDTRSGPVSIGRGLAFGIDEDGLSLSTSHAVATRFGPAVAGSLNLSIGFDGSVSGSHSNSVARGGFAREASAGGSTRVGFGGPVSTATAGGSTVGGGSVVANTDSYTRRPLLASHRPVHGSYRPAVLPRPGHGPTKVFAKPQAWCGTPVPGR